MSYSDDRNWSDRYIPAIGQIVGPHLVVPAPLEIDPRQATDLIVLKARDMTIAARVRRAEYATCFPYDFTVRCRRDSGAKAEMRKVTLPLFDESHNRGSYAASPCWAASQFFSNVMGLT